jgi:hypothetical protein
VTKYINKQYNKVEASLKYGVLINETALVAHKKIVQNIGES